MSDLNVTAASPNMTGMEKNTASEPTVKPVEVEKSVTELKPAAEVKPDQEKKQAVPEEVEHVVEEMNAFMQSMQRNLSFSVDEQLGKDIVSVTDVETEEVIRQIPSEDLMVLLKKMDDVAGILFDTKV
ncbi:flagellar protein FlaG [Psychromonas ossibalaenae]|uniref:flagellar protein FlaG n=1 Tax=Psychromonas ossibalaenae TaxID=444922 RepID=UPI00036CE8DD|nr:flagellar protein FlaG [Psychromonas ossibalaenae]